MAFGSAPGPSSFAQVSAGTSIYIDRLCGCEAWLACSPAPCRVSVPLRKGLRVPLRSRKMADGTHPARRAGWAHRPRIERIKRRVDRYDTILEVGLGPWRRGRCGYRPCGRCPCVDWRGSVTVAYARCGVPIPQEGDDLSPHALQEEPVRDDHCLAKCTSSPSGPRRHDRAMLGLEGQEGEHVASKEGHARQEGQEAQRARRDLARPQRNGRQPDSERSGALRKRT
jgi:hypothetical protein